MGGGERENKFFMEGEINKFFGTGSNTTKKPTTIMQSSGNSGENLVLHIVNAL